MRKSIRSTGYAGGKSRYAAASSKRRSTSIAAIRRGAFPPPASIQAARKTDQQIVSVPLSGAVTATWNEFDLAAPIAAGASLPSRMGNEIWVTGIRIRGVFEGGQAYPSPTAADDPYNVCRIVVGCYQKTLGTTSFLSGIGLHQSIDKQTVGGVVKVCQDKTFCFSSPGQSGVGYQLAARLFDFWVPVNFKVCFLGNAQSQNTSQVVVSVVSDSTVVPSCAIKGTCTMYYSP